MKAYDSFNTLIGTQWFIIAVVVLALLAIGVMLLARWRGPDRG
jgi:hypothetical protein